MAITELKPILRSIADIERNLKLAKVASPDHHQIADQNVTAALTILQFTESGFPQYELARELKNNERRRFLMIYSTIKSLITMGLAPPPGGPREIVIDKQLDAINALRNHLSAFNAGLLNEMP